MNKKKPQFSVISVCWNEGESIRRTCESIRTQNHNNFEWIVIDGKSTDSTLDILNKYSTEISTLISEPDYGIYNAMNKGIELAKGDYLVFLNGGDQFCNNETLNLIATAPQMDIIYGNLITTHSNGTEIVETFPDKLEPNYLLWGWLPHPASFIRQRLFNDFGIYDESFQIAGDYDLFARFLSHNSTTHHHINQPLSIFSTGGISTNPSHRKQLDKERHLIRKKYFRSYRWSLKGIRREIRQLVSDATFKLFHF
jgi:glycosyltransferase involved in cell wall biosynthesis